jgi:hypothetical protein
VERSRVFACGRIGPFGKETPLKRRVRTRRLGGFDCMHQHSRGAGVSGHLEFNNANGQADLSLSTAMSKTSNSWTMPVQRMWQLDRPRGQIDMTSRPLISRKVHQPTTKAHVSLQNTPAALFLLLPHSKDILLQLLQLLRNPRNVLHLQDTKLSHIGIHQLRRHPLKPLPKYLHIPLL